MKDWKKNILICWVGCFTTSCGMSLVVPFLPFFIQQLGVKNLNYVEQLSGLAFGITFLFAAIMSPLWGKISDTHGRKVALMCTSLGMCIVNFFTGFSVNIYMLIFFRILQGLASGYIPAAVSLIAKETPEENVGWALATLTTGSMAGSLIGPVVGGYLDELMGIRNVFFVTAGFLFLSFLVTKLFLVEKIHAKPLKEIKKGDAEQSIWSRIEYKYLVFGLLISSCVINTANQSIEPIVSLYVKHLFAISHTNSTHLSLYSGLVMSATGFGVLLTASKIGRLGDRTSYLRVFCISILCSAAIFIPMAFVRNAWELMGLRFILGITQAGIMPAIATMLSKVSPDDISGRMFGYNQAAQFAGLVIGPILGGQLSSHFGFACIFFSTSFLLIVNFLMMIIISKNNNKELSKLSI